MVVLGLAYNLSQNHTVFIYHPLIKAFEPLAPFIKGFDRPKSLVDLDGVDECLLIYEDSPFFTQFQPLLKTHFKEKLFVLNPVVTARKDYPFVEDFWFNPKQSFSQNLLEFGKLHYLDQTQAHFSGLINSYQKDPNLIVIHAGGSRQSKSWPKHKFLNIKAKLEKKGHQVIFATLPHEIATLGEDLYSGLKSFQELIEHVAKARLLIGNDSGVAHLASALNTPSVVICRNKRFQKFWRPDYQGPSHPLLPPSWIPNIKNFRLRDRYWKQFIFKNTVFKKALELLHASHSFL